MKKLPIITCALIMCFALTAAALILCHESPAKVEQLIFADQGGVRVFAENGKVGLMNSKEKVLLEAEYDMIDAFGDSDFAIIQRDGRSGVVRRDGSLAVPCECRYVSIWSEERIAQVEIEELEFHMIDLDSGDIIIEKSPIVYTQNGQYYIDEYDASYDGWLIAGRVEGSTYEEADHRYVDGVKPMIRLAGGFAVIENWPQDEEIYAFYDDELALLCKDVLQFDIHPDGSVSYVRKVQSKKSGGDKRTVCGVLGSDGIPVETEGSKIWPKDSCGLYCVNTSQNNTPGKGCWGYMDSTGAFVIEPMFDQAYPFVDGSAVGMKDGVWRLIDRTGAQVGQYTWTQPVYENEEYMMLPVVPVAERSGWRLLNRRGVCICNELPGTAGDFDDDYYGPSVWNGVSMTIDRSDGGFAMVSDEGEILIERADRLYRAVQPSLMWFLVDGKWGLMFVDGENAGEWLVTPCLDYANAPMCSKEEGIYYFTVSDAGKIGVDTEGNICVPGSIRDYAAFEKAMNEVFEQLENAAGEPSLQRTINIIHSPEIAALLKTTAG